MNGLTTFQPSLSVETPITERPRSLYLFWKSTNSGISTLQPSHQVAQKFSRTTFPLKSESFTAWPEASLKVKFGAIFRSSTGVTSAETGREAERHYKIATEHSRQRCASTPDTGSAMKPMHAATAPAAIQVNLRLCPLLKSC